jgi:hypothetical protein
MAAGGLAGCVAGAICFPRDIIVEVPVEVVRTVEKPVEIIKVIEKPVEVVREVQKVVEVPAKFSAEQIDDLAIAQRLRDVKNIKFERSLFKQTNRVKVVNLINSESNVYLPKDLATARVETIFRNRGFKILSSDSTEFPFTVIVIKGVGLGVSNQGGTTLGSAISYGMEIRQFVLYFPAATSRQMADSPIKHTEMILWEDGGLILKSRDGSADLTKPWEELAEQAANHLAKVNEN